MPDAFADVLVERDGVLEPRAARVRRGREETVVRRMPAIDFRMRHAAEHRKAIPMFLQRFEVRRQRIAASAFLGEEMFRQQAEVIADAEHPARLSARRHASRRLRHGREYRRHRVQQRQGEEDARATKKLAARERRPGRDERGVHRLFSFVAPIWMADKSHLLRKRSLCTSSWMRLRTP